MLTRWPTRSNPSARCSALLGMSLYCLNCPTSTSAVCPISDLLQRQLLPDASLNWEPEGAMGFVRLLMPMISAPLPPDPPIALLGHVAQSPVVPLFGIVVAPLLPPPVSAL